MSTFIPIQEVLLLPMLGGDDYFQRRKGRLLTWSKHVYADMNMTSIKVPVRQVYQINKRTNTIDLPKKTIRVCSVEISDRYGAWYPVWRNERLDEQMVEIPAEKNCACEHKCGYALCNTIKGYVSVVTTKTDSLPNGNPISFTCVDRQAVDANGFFYSETQYPLRIFANGVWVNTVLHKEQKKMCQVEVDDNGCVCDTEKNLDLVCSCTGGNTAAIPYGGNSQSFCDNPAVNTWIYYCNSKLDWFSYQCGGFPRDCNNIYNISEMGDRLIFPKNFGFDKVRVRTYEEPDLNNLQIPFISVNTFILGCLFWDTQFNPKEQKLAAIYEQRYALSKFGLIGELNKYTIEEQRMMFTPPVFVPSYEENSNIS